MRRILLVVDVTDDTVAQAIQVGADMILAHHPLLLRGVHTVATDTPKGRLLHQLVSAGISLQVAHTNADAARPGVSDALAVALGLPSEGLAPLRGVDPFPLDALATTVPTADAQRVLDAICEAGAGSSGGNYERSAFLIEGIGTFVPGTAARPAFGEVGRVNEVRETRIETILPRSHRAAVVRALLQVHPYEEPAFQMTELAPVDASTGLGRVGTLPTPMTLRAFTQHVAAVLPAAPVGIRASGDPDRLISRVAVVGGAGDSMLGDAAAAGADVFVTSDIRHHVASEFAAAGSHTGGPALIDAGHWATERPWLDQAAWFLREDLGRTVDIEVSDLVTDPWTVKVP